MTKTTAVQAAHFRLDVPQSLSDLELDQVSGGLNPQPLPPGMKIQALSIGSQSSGAGAGKVAFNPF